MGIPTTFIESLFENSRKYIKNANDTAFTSRQYLRTNLQVMELNSARETDSKRFKERKKENIF